MDITVETHKDFLEQQIAVLPEGSDVSKDTEVNDIVIKMITWLLTDFYQVTMSYSYWQNGKALKRSVFEMYYRTSPFANVSDKGKYVVFSGLDRVLNLMRVLCTVGITDEDIVILKDAVRLSGNVFEDGFYTFLKTLDFSQVTIRSVPHGDICAPNLPILAVEGPLIMCQILETTLLNLCAFPTLVATYASILTRLAPGKAFLEFGTRRAQGPDGAYSASKYSYVGGFSGTSNVLAGAMNNISVVGTMAHSSIVGTSAWNDTDESLERMENSLLLSMADLRRRAINVIELLVKHDTAYGSTDPRELCAFINYAFAFPNKFLALIDTYNTVSSGARNYIIVGIVLDQLGFKPVGVRLDSGDLAQLSKDVRALFRRADEYTGKTIFAISKIVASNEIGVKTLIDLLSKGHEIDVFGIGTMIATCKDCPSLGLVYKLVDVEDMDGNMISTMKLSEEPAKASIPCNKDVYKMYNLDGQVVGYIASQRGVIPQINDDGVLICNEIGSWASRDIRCTRVEKASYVLYGESVSVRTTIHDARAFYEGALQKCESLLHGNKCNSYITPELREVMIALETVNCVRKMDVDECWWKKRFSDEQLHRCCDGSEMSC
jgi:nicotinate phosphoribosyltransferase